MFFEAAVISESFLGLLFNHKKALANDSGFAVSFADFDKSAVMFCFQSCWKQNITADFRFSAGERKLPRKKFRKPLSFSPVLVSFPKTNKNVENDSDFALFPGNEAREKASVIFTSPLCL